jgi:aminoglycoside phosphotransferase (APT) family kinase protein
MNLTQIIGAIGLLATLSGCISISLPNDIKNKEISDYKIDNKYYSLDQVKEKYPQLQWEAFRKTALTKWTNKDIKQAQINILKGGFSTDAIFTINLSSKAYVLRFIGKERPIENRNIIIQSSKWAGQHNFGPKIYLADAEALFMLMEFVEGRTLELKDTHDPEILKALGKILSQIHKAPIPTSNYHEMSQFTIGKSWYNSVRNTKDKIFGPSILKEAYSSWLKINNVINHHPIKKTMLHNDPNLRNIMWHNKKITLLDWELSGVEDPIKELAHVCAWMGLNENLTKEFLSSYYGRNVTAKEMLVIEKLRKMILLEIAWVGLSSLKTDTHLSQKMWDELYEKAPPQTVETLSIIQMNSEKKPSEEKLMKVFLGLIKQFMLETIK